MTIEDKRELAQTIHELERASRIVRAGECSGNVYCLSCRHYKPEAGECRCRAPRMEQRCGSTTPRFPRMKATDFCGEHAYKVGWLFSLDSLLANLKADL